MEQTANIFVLIDGLGWEWVKSTSFLSGIAPYRRALETVLGFSAGAIPSILTGRYPSEHGRMTMFRHARNERSSFRNLKWLCAMPPRLVENRYVRHALELVVRKSQHIEGYFNLYHIPLRLLPLLEIGEKRDIYRPAGIPGSTSIFDLLANKKIAHRSYSYHQGTDAKLLAKAERDILQGVARFFFIYLAEVDAYLHAHANQPALAAQLLRRYDTAIEHLYRVALNKFGTVNLHVFSDHGMAPTMRTVDVENQLKSLPLITPGDFFYLLDSTMARFWFKSPQVRAAVMQALPDGDDGQWLSEAELRSMRAWFADGRFGEEIYLMPEGAVIAPSYMGRTAPAGMHGFHPHARHSDAAVLSSKDYGNELNHISDLFSMMERHTL